MRGFFLCCTFSQAREGSTAGGEERKRAETEREREMQKAEQQQPKLEGLANFGNLSFNGGDDEELSRSALATFRAKEEEIERKTMEVRERFQAQLGRVEEESKRLAMIREVFLVLTTSSSKFFPCFKLYLVFLAIFSLFA